MNNSDNKLGLGALCALVIGSIIGAGVFSLPQNMAAVASPLAVMIGWLITGIGMIFLALTFQRLCDNKPHINSGVFGYAKEGFGDLVGFFSAWGYWISSLMANVSYLVILFSTLGLIFDTPQHAIFGQGNTLISITFASIFLWLVHLLLLKGVQTASAINAITTVAKLIPLFIFIIAAMFAFKLSTFTWDLTGLESHSGKSLIEQIESTMSFTVWVFIGIEGAVIVSGRARHRKDIGRATILGLLTTLSIYIMVSLLSMGIVSTPELAAMQNPSAAKVLEKILGPVGLYVIGIGLLISVLGAYLSWTLLAVECPYSAAKEKMFPKAFLKTNANGTPYFALLCSNIVVQVSLLAVTFSGGTYATLLNISSEMILVPYLLVGLYALKVGVTEKCRATLIIGIMGSLYGFWLIYASGIHHMLVASFMYLAGISVFVTSKKQYRESWFIGNNRLIIVILLLLGTIGLGIY